MGLFLSAGFGRTSLTAHEIWPRIGLSLLSLWGLYGAIQAYRWVWPRKLASDAAAASSFEFYLRALEQRRDYGKHVWRRAGLTFCFLGLAMVVLPALIDGIQHSDRQLLNLVPFFLLLFTWIPAFLYFKKRGQRKIQQEIDDLRKFESGN